MNNNPNRGSRRKTKENPMKSVVTSLLTGSLFLSAAMAGETGPSTGAVIKDVSLGHKDFYPSPQHPVGFRGDGNGCFPGATPVAEFWDGTPAQVDRPLMTESFGKKLDLKGKTTAKVWDVTDEKSKNLVWKTRLPGWSLADPVVVGDRVFCVGEPDWLTCADANTGKVLWQKRVLPLLCDGKTPEEAARLQQVIDIAAVFYTLRRSLLVSLPEAVAAPMAAKLVERLPAWRKTIQDADNDPKLLDAFDRGAAAIASRAGVTVPKEAKPDFGALVGAVEKKYRVPVGTQWYGHVGLATSTPVSDGERVYVTYCQGQVAAYDLNGHLVWAKRFAEWAHASVDGKDGFINTPLLCDQVLIVNSPAGSKYRALNARTGELLWERKEALWRRVNAARVVRLRTAQGDPVNAVLYPRGHQIRRAEDDRVLGEVPFTFKESNDYLGFQWLVNHDMVLFMPGPYVDKSAAIFYRLRATTADRVDVEKVYEMPKGRVIVGANHLATTPEYVLFGGFKGLPLLLQPFGDPITLENTAIATAIPCGQNIVAGKTIFSLFDADGGNNDWFRGPRPDPGGQGGQGRATDRKAMVRIVTADLTNPAAVRIVGDRNLLQEAGPAADIYVEQYLSGIDPFLFAGCYHGSASFFGGKMGSMTPSGNRVFIQSATHLRCIGDPAVNYDWNPASRPAHITSALKSRETPK